MSDLTVDRVPDHYHPAGRLRARLEEARQSALDLAGGDIHSPHWDVALELAELAGVAAELAGALDEAGMAVRTTARRRLDVAERMWESLRDMCGLDHPEVLRTALERARLATLGVEEQARTVIHASEEAC